ncbi:MAG TPA: glycosyltransferase family 4 protein [Solirubrobacterales bacterium]|nr:glycosyltransferase family 4 protein [Solirubrobacterales bacterium]
MNPKLAPRIVSFATQGSGHGDELRIRELLADLDPEPLPFDRGRRLRSAAGLLGRLLRRRPDLVVMEGTGVGGGLALIAARLLAGVPYVVSSGDAVGPYIGLGHPWAAPLAAVYERLLCRWSAGFIGWSPYLVGRALTFGAPRAMTAAGWSAPAAGLDRAERRRALGIPADAVVFGLIGSLRWNDAVGYCYGLELVQAALAAERDDLRVLVVGDGSGLPRLRELADRADGRVILTGRVPKEEVGSYLAALDVASLPQSVDGVGSFRYTTKISEYLGAGLPVVTGEIPLAYDLDDGWLWRLPGAAPWDPRYLAALAELMRTVTAAELAARRAAAPRDLPLFDRARQRRLVAEFITDLLARS